MTEAIGAPTPPTSTQPKIKTWLIIIGMCILVCCFCVGAIGLLVAFGEPIMNELGLIHAMLPCPII